ncbi:MAG: TonB family protein [Paludibacteraceae bacterium]
MSLLQNPWKNSIMNKPQIYSSIVTIVIAALIVLLLMFIYMPFNKEQEEEGIMISFGDGIEGLGELAPPVVTTTSTPQSATPPAAKEDLMTQDVEETIDLEAQKKEQERKRQEQIIAEQKRQEELERQRIEAEQKRIEAEQAEKTAKANQAAGVFGQQISGVGKAVGSGTAGNPAGKGSSNGNSWSLNGRDLRGELYKPSYDKDEAGKVVVSIRVNENGDVIATSIASGTTISDSNLREAAMKAARNTKFSSGTNVAIGTITYIFNLNL